MSQDSSPELRLTLLENGLDFVREGVEALYKRNGAVPSRAYKYALLNIFSGTLLILKEKLRRAHRSLIFSDVANVAPGAKTIDFETTIARLTGAARVPLDRSDQDLLRKVQKQRNTIEHFEVSIQIHHADALVGELVDFLDRFLREQLKESLFNHVSGQAASRIAELAKVSERLRRADHARWRKLAAKYRKLTLAQLANLASEHSYHPKHNPDGAARPCPLCGEESVVEVQAEVAVCTHRTCRAVLRTVSCCRCGGTAFDGTDFCDDCRSYIEYQREDD